MSKLDDIERNTAIKKYPDRYRVNVWINGGTGRITMYVLADSRHQAEQIAHDHIIKDFRFSTEKCENVM